MENEIKIDKGIPIPKLSYNNGIYRKRKYPFRQMEVGDSFIISEEYSRDIMSRKGTAARAWSAKSGMGYKFSLHKTSDNKIRIWRIK